MKGYINPSRDDDDNSDHLSSTSLRTDNELFDEESHVVHKLFGIRHVMLPKGGEDWEILEDNKVVLTIKGIKLTKKQRSHLKDPQILNKILQEYKNGITSMNKIKTLINKLIK